MTAIDDNITGLAARDSSPATNRVLLVALGVFVLAGLTGALFRFAGAYGVTLGLDPVGMRHGHSHLMYFGWITPALFALIASAIPGPFPTRTIRWTLVMAIVAYVPFLLWGYSSVAIGSAMIPISVIAASANMVVWYFWIAWYRRVRTQVEHAPARLLWDAAAWFMIAASAAAWSVAVAVPLGVATPLVKNVLAHAFLDWFSEGWFTFGVLGVACSRFRTRVPRWAIGMAAAGATGSFLLGMPGYQTTEMVQVLARLFGLLAAVGTIGLIRPMWTRTAGHPLWALAMWLLAIKSAGQIGAVFVFDTWWADVVPARVLYLHMHVLGFASLAVAAHLLRGRLRTVFAMSVLLVLISLVPMTDFWPAPVDGAFAAQVAAWISLGPTLVATVALVILPFRAMDV